MRAASLIAALGATSRRGSLASPARIWRWLLVLFVAVAATQIAVVALANPPAPVVWFDVGAPGDDDYLTGMYLPEHDASGQWRWTESAADLTLPLPTALGDATWRVELLLTSPGITARDLLLQCGSAIMVVPLPAQFTDLRTTIDCSPPDDTLRLALTVDPVRPIADGRALGVAIRELRVTAVGTTAIWQTRIQSALALAALITGAVAALAAAGVQPLAERARLRASPQHAHDTMRTWVIRLVVIAATAAVALLTLGLLGLSATGSPWLISVAAPRPTLLALATGVLALTFTAQLTTQSRVRTGVLAALLPVIAIVIPDPPLVLTTVAQWSRDDPDARLLLPWLVVALGLAAVALGGRRAPRLAAAASMLAVATSLLPPMAARIVQRWSVTLTLPDWNAPVSVLGGVLLIALLLSTALLLHAALASRRSDAVRLTLVLTVILATLLPWRALTMQLNGDEPHYAVIARSLKDDRDLELLDDYRGDAYRDAVYSPDGNVAVERSDGTDRYAAVWAPISEPRWLLIPPADLATLVPAISAAPAPGVIPSSTSQFVRTSTGDLDTLPLLTAATDLSIAVPISAPCQPLTLLIATPDAPTSPAPPAELLVEMTSAIGNPLKLAAPAWQDGVGSLMLFPPDALTTDCRSATAISVHIRAATPVIAQMIDTSNGLRILPAAPATQTQRLGPLPDDDFGSRDAVAHLALANPNDSPVEASITIHTHVPGVVIEQQVTLPPRTATRVTLPSRSGAAVTVAADLPLAATLIGWLPGGSYVAPQLQPLADWALVPSSSTDRVAGLRVALLSPDAADTATTSDGSIELCLSCAVTEVVTTNDNLTDATPDGSTPLYVGAVQFTEVSGPLHFDLLLPLLSAAPAGLLFPWGGLLIPAISTLALALGLLRLLQRLAADHPAWPHSIPLLGAALTVLLAPVSPFAVRLYTEPVAAALLVWALVWLDQAQHTRRWFQPIAGATAVVAILPILHGRYLPLAAVLALVILWSATRNHRRLLLLALPLGALALGLLALSPLAVALQSRGSPSYLSTEWLPHNLAGMLVDRGSGLLIWAPWVLLALCSPLVSRLSSIQRNALLLIATQLTVTMLRAGGWQTFSPPARYLLPVVPLIALFAVPGAVRLWHSRPPFGRVATSLILALSAGATLLLHWSAPVGYALPPNYPIDALAAHLWPARLLTLAPHLAPEITSNPAGMLLLTALWLAVTQILIALHWKNPRTNADSSQNSH